MADSPDQQSTPATTGRSRVRARTVVIVIGAIVLGLGIAWFFASRNQDEGTPAAFLGVDKVGEPVRSIGPLKGSNLKKYASSRQKALAAAGEPRMAVVSLDRYTTDREARSAVGISEVIAFLAATPGGAPSVAGRDLKAWADKEREEAKAEREGFKSQIPTVDDAVTRRQFEAEVQRLSALIDRVTPTSPIVFAIVIRAPADRLKELARSPGVRLVDVGSSDKPSDRPAYIGIRPEETSKAGEPETRPL